MRAKRQIWTIPSALAFGLVGLTVTEPVTVYAQELTIGGQLRPRYETKDPGSTDGREAFTSMRSRLHVAAEPERGVRVFLQLQDVRVWGEEESTLGDFSAENLDLHQGYAEIDVGAENAARVRVGRQEVRLAGERLVGAVDWTQQGRSFNGVRALLGPGRGGVDLFGFKLRDSTAPDSDDDVAFLGAYAVVGLPVGGTVDLYGLYNRERGTSPSDQGTFGARWERAGPEWNHRIEASYQTGTRRGLDADAYMVGARLGRVVNGLVTVSLWYDYLSGERRSGEGRAGTFDTLFATNHKYYGHADLFLDIPLHTAGRGLQNYAIKLFLSPSDVVTAGLDLHAFRMAEVGDLDTGRLGEEIDFTIGYQYTPSLSVTGGASYVFQQEGWARIDRLHRDLLFGFLMLDVQF